jgi:hypothetical protein
LVEVDRFRVTVELIAQTEDALRAAGAEGYEAFVLWSGSQQGRVFDIQTHHVPKQTSYRLPTGLCVRVGGEELHRLNVWLFEAGETLAVQVHAHPDEAYHSDTDNAYPIVATLGGVSIVVPDFCRDGLFVEGTAIYRLGANSWVRQPRSCIEVIP